MGGVQGDSGGGGGASRELAGAGGPCPELQQGRYRTWVKVCGQHVLGAATCPCYVTAPGDNGSWGCPTSHSEQSYTPGPHPPHWA